jgi:hypothetical protein
MTEWFLVGMATGVPLGLFVGTRLQAGLYRRLGEAAKMQASLAQENARLHGELMKLKKGGS